VSGSEQPSREELLALIEAQARTIEELRAEVAELKRRLGRNSRNSSQPPSTDGPAVSPSRAARRHGARRPGKQPGAGGSALFQTSDPDEVIDHVPQACGGCGSDLTGAAALGVVRRQVHDIPTITPVVVEHRLHRRRCGCGTTTTAAAPAGVGAAAVYGPNLRALAVYLLVFQHIPVARAQALIADLTGAHPSTGWISSQLVAVAEVLVDVEKLIKTLIVLAHVIHVDETTSTINGVRWWLHVACTDTLTAYHLHPSRGRAAVTEFDVLPAFRGTVVHDALSVYDAYPGARHALCGAHISRELVAAGEADPDQTWPAQALRALHGLNTAAHHARDQQLPAIPPETAQPLLDSWRHALLVGLAEHRRTRTPPVQDPQPARAPTRPRPPGAAVRPRPVGAVHQQPGRARRPPHQDPDEDQWLPPLRHHRESMAAGPRLHLHRPQARRQHPRRAARRHHWQPLETTRDLLT
jgi:transposase